MGDVIDLFTRRKKKVVEQVKKEKEKTKEKAKSFAKSIDEVMHVNVSNMARLRKERDQANKNVMKSYKIK